MSGSFSIALSGLTADTDALDIVGNNLANLNTTGYKDTTASFYDLLAQTAGGGAIQIGGGVSATIGQSQFYSGIHSAYRGAFDGAIQGMDSLWFRILPETRCIRGPATSSSTPTGL